MKKAYINPNKCDRSPFCPAKRVCPVKAITQEKKGFFKMGPSVVNADVCVGCGKCAEVCPAKAIKIK